MAITKESLEKVKERVDLAEVISTYVPLKSAGATYKGLCPFHEEKSPSFVIKKGDSHYHCFGCGAHGDAIGFLMNHLSLSFHEAVEMLADRFGVTLEETEQNEKGPDKKKMREALVLAGELFHFTLLHTDEGHHALKYLYDRGIDLEFIQLFSIGLAPKEGRILNGVMKEKGFAPPLLVEAGLVKKQGYPFFSDRITFPILDATGHLVGFSARKYKESTEGPKYINTPDTPLFKKSHILYGLNFSRQRIAKEKKVLIVEGQIDALRLIQSGLNFTVAGQGTAFTEEGAKQLMQLGVSHVYLALDGDNAGQQATIKIGHFFQKEGVEVTVIEMPVDADPDSLLKDEGPEAFLKRLDSSKDYLAFLVDFYAQTIDIASPSGKSQIAEKVTLQIQQWDHPLMVHESLRKLAHLLTVPEKVLGFQVKEENTLVKKKGSITQMEINPDRILEIDVFRWLYLCPELTEFIKRNLQPKHFRIAVCRRIYEQFLVAEVEFATFALSLKD
ncbi:MAG: DNA primase, partial [Simkaniaceae bacterium]|nr:DNA primase [Simkaniaceae bacterium]